MRSKILIIDDDSKIHTLVKAQLDRQKFEVTAANTAAGGLAAAKEQLPDLILLDVDMRDTQGFEVCRQLKADRSTRSIPVIFLTAAVDVGSRVFGLECGANDYLTKPFHPAELQARVRAALRTKSQLDEATRNSVFDELTETFDRKYFDLRLDAELAVARRSGRPLGCLLIDIDDMELVNTWFGTSVGDNLLHRVGQAIAGVCRREDIVCRFEGDEFGVLVSDTDAISMAELAERARLAVRNITSVVKQGAVQVTASVGFALARFSDGSSIVDEAADALGRAQRAGGDRVRAGRELAELRLAL